MWYKQVAGTEHNGQFPRLVPCGSSDHQLHVLMVKISNTFRDAALTKQTKKSNKKKPKHNKTKKTIKKKIQPKIR